MTEEYPKIIRTQMPCSVMYDRVDSLAEELHIRAGRAEEAGKQAMEEHMLWAFVDSEVERIATEEVDD